MPGVINNPGNRSLRRAIFDFATKRMCAEMLERSLALKLRNQDPGVGRFFPRGCTVSKLPNENLLVQFSGDGYAWTNVTGRMGFEASARVEYEHDFLVAKGNMYVYFRQKTRYEPRFQVRMVENAKQASLASVAGLVAGSVKQAAQKLGAHVLDQQLARGFTVVRGGDGSVSFAMGVVEKGETVAVPFARADSDLQILANERVEVHPNQRDYLGPFGVPKGSNGLTLTVRIDGASALDLLVVPKAACEPWLSQYQHYGRTGPPVQPALLEDVIRMPAPTPSHAAGMYRRSIPLPPGRYYLVVDHTVTAGKTMPGVQGQKPVAALVSYAVQRGQAD